MNIFGIITLFIAGHLLLAALMIIALRRAKKEFNITDQ